MQAALAALILAAGFALGWLATGPLLEPAEIPEVAPPPAPPPRVIIDPKVPDTEVRPQLRPRRLPFSVTASKADQFKR